MMLVIHNKNGIKEKVIFNKIYIYFFNCEGYVDNFVWPGHDDAEDLDC